MPHRAVVNFLAAWRASPGWPRATAGRSHHAVVRHRRAGTAAAAARRRHGSCSPAASRPSTVRRCGAAEQARHGHAGDPVDLAPAARRGLERPPASRLWSAARHCGAIWPTQLLRAATGELWNMYGPTETTVWSTCCAGRREPPDGSRSAGRSPTPASTSSTRMVQPVPDRRRRRDLHRRRRRHARLPQPARTHCRALHCRSVQPARRAPASTAPATAAAGATTARSSTWAARPPGQGPRLPHRARTRSSRR